MRITFITDPGHAWLSVPISELKRLGIEYKISSCSYMNGNRVYLEEDCDAPIYIKATGLDINTIRETYSERSKVRNYNFYHPPCDHKSAYFNVHDMNIQYAHCSKCGKRLFRL